VALSVRPAFMGGLRIRLDQRVRAAVIDVARRVHALGHEVVVADPPYGLLGLNFLPRSLAGVEEWCAAAPDRSLLDFRTSDTGRMGARLAGRALRWSRASLDRHRRRVGRLFERVDVVLAPTTATPPLPIGSIDGLSGWRTDKAVMTACPYAWPWNALGWPGLNIPAGFVDGLPVGAQLLGPDGGEELLISLAAQLESEMEWAASVPDLERAALGAAAGLP
jgi:amidase